jgi:peptidoglycan biosynthesis protein MviN/MurJ (putative lipid II flippase)
VAFGVSVGEWGRVWWLQQRWNRAITDLPEGIEESSDNGFAAAAGHQMVAQGVLSAAQFIERFLVGTVAVAAISHVEYALRLVMVLAVLFDGGIGPWLLARWSNIRVRSALPSDWTNVYRPLIAAGFVAMAVSAVLILAAPVVVAVVLRHGAFTVADAAAVTQLVRWYGLGFFLNMNALCIERLLLARAQNRLFARLATLRATTRIVTVLLLLDSLGVLALPTAFIISEFIYLIALVVASRLETARPLETVHT